MPSGSDIKMKYYIIVFKNTLDAMSGEKTVKEMGLSFRMMPTPTSITQSCGLCVRLDDEEAVNKVINEGNISYKNIYSYTDKKGRLKIKIVMENCYGENICGKAILPVLKEVLRVPFSISDEGCKINPETNECSVVIEESPKYHMLSYVASTPKDGEKYSGDSFNFGKNKHGIYVIAYDI